VPPKRDATRYDVVVFSIVCKIEYKPVEPRRCTGWAQKWAQFSVAISGVLQLRDKDQMLG